MASLETVLTSRQYKVYQIIHKRFILIRRKKPYMTGTGFKLKDLGEFVGTTADTIKKDLEYLIEIGLLKTHTEGYIDSTFTVYTPMVDLYSQQSIDSFVNSLTENFS